MSIISARLQWRNAPDRAVPQGGGCLTELGSLVSFGGGRLVGRAILPGNSARRPGWRPEPPPAGINPRGGLSVTPLPLNKLEATGWPALLGRQSCLRTRFRRVQAVWKAGLQPRLAAPQVVIRPFRPAPAGGLA